MRRYVSRPGLIYLLFLRYACFLDQSHVFNNVGTTTRRKIVSAADGCLAAPAGELLDELGQYQRSVRFTV
jgi:hypothetical protein